MLTESFQSPDGQNAALYVSGRHDRPSPRYEAQQLLDHHVHTPQTAQLGPLYERTDIKSTIGPFLVLPEYQTVYPATVSQALVNLYAEYNQAFTPLVAANREWETDYQHSLSPQGTPINRWVQIDMVGLPDGFLKQAQHLDPQVIQEVIRHRVFEYENSLAMYQLLANIFRHGDNDETYFKRSFFSSLDRLRAEQGKPVALLAVTDQKYEAMRGSEFGKVPGEPLTPSEVRELSGFDHFFGPQEFLEHLSANGGKSEYLLFVRSSDPVAKLRKPDTVVENPLLANEQVRRAIKANAITFNIDAPGLPLGSPARINDTKAWMPEVGMAFPAHSVEDLKSPEFQQFLLSQGITQEEIASGTVRLRGKPMQASYGGYGHQRAELGNGKFHKDLRSEISKRGPYVIQPEMQTPLITNEATGISYTYIDRNFFATNGETYHFMGGFRSLMPVHALEADRGRVHGNGSTVWAEIK